ncbi:undecaprenyl-diphosphatase UppP [Patescibacteria group bacterium]|nr:undecaprenyl-diphosphatase UppP [Patescibacteria group bacterium]
MSFIHVLILSIIEGLTEFLPISSTGHMILAGRLMNIPQTEFVKSFEIIIQLGAILAVVVLYLKTLLKRISLFPKILAAFFPTAIIGFILYKLVKAFLLGNALVTVFALGIGGVSFLILEQFMKHKIFKTQSLDEISYKQSLFIGLTQSISMIPGVSRSAASIFGAMVVGIDRTTAVEFSFLLAIPTMIAATVLDLVKSGFTFSSNDIILLSLGFIGAFVTALLYIKAFLQFIKSNTFIPFAWYRIFLAGLFALYIIKA